MQSAMIVPERDAFGQGWIEMIVAKKEMVQKELFLTKSEKKHPAIASVKRINSRSNSWGRNQFQKISKELIQESVMEEFS